MQTEGGAKKGKYIYIYMYIDDINLEQDQQPCTFVMVDSCKLN